MAHRVLLKAAPLRIRKKRTVIHVSANGEKLGELQISAAGVRWKAGKSKATPQLIQWEKFAQIIEQHDK